MGKLIIIRGNSSSGKTAAARELQRRFGPGTLLVCQDAVRREMLMVPDGPGTAALPLLTELLRYGGRNCKVVILEGILRAAWYGELFAAAREEFGDRIFAYYYDLPFEETVRRHAVSANAGSFGEAELRRWWAPQDLIGTIPEKRLTEKLTLADAVEQIYADAAAE